MITKYVLTNAVGPTLISHEDQEKAGMRFRRINIEPLGLGYRSLIIVQADDPTVVMHWINRVEGREIHANKARAHAKTLLAEAKTQRLAELEVEKAEVTNWTIANVMGGMN